MKRPSGAVEMGQSDDGARSKAVKRARPSQLLSKLRNAHRHRQAQIARPQGTTGNVHHIATTRQNEMPAASNWTKRGVLFALVPLSIVGMVALFVLGFVGSREIVTYLVGREFVPPTLSAVEPDFQRQSPAPVEPERRIAPHAAEAVPAVGHSDRKAQLTLAAMPRDGSLGPAVDDLVPPSQDAEVPPAIEPEQAITEVPPSDENVASEPERTRTPPHEETRAAATLADGPVAAEEAPIATETEAEPAEATTISETSEPSAATVAAEGETRTRRDNDDRSDDLKQGDALAAAQSDATPARPIDAARLIGEGHSLMAAGQITEARELFKRGLSSGSPEAALALGRSFDPKHLAGIRAPNAAADPAAARHWYQEWYRRSIEQGAVSPNVRLEKLLRTMNVN